MAKMLWPREHAEEAPLRSCPVTFDWAHVRIVVERPGHYRVCLPSLRSKPLPPAHGAQNARSRTPTDLHARSADISRYAAWTA